MLASARCMELPLELIPGSSKTAAGSAPSSSSLAGVILPGRPAQTAPPLSAATLQAVVGSSASGMDDATLQRITSMVIAATKGEPAGDGTGDVRMEREDSAASEDGDDSSDATSTASSDDEDEVEAPPPEPSTSKKKSRSKVQMMDSGV